MHSTKKRSAAALLAILAVLLLCAACSADNDAVPPYEGGHTDIEEPVGLIGFESPVPDGFTFEIMPDADQNIYEMNVSYRLGDEAWGEETMKTEDGTFFGLDDVVMKEFRIADLGVDDAVPPMTLSFTFTDASGTVTPAQNEYTVESPQTEGLYLVKITGSQQAGYVLSNQ